MSAARDEPLEAILVIWSNLVANRVCEHDHLLSVFGNCKRTERIRDAVTAIIVIVPTLNKRLK